METSTCHRSNREETKEKHSLFTGDDELPDSNRRMKFRCNDLGTEKGICYDQLQELSLDNYFIHLETLSANDLFTYH